MERLIKTLANGNRIVFDTGTFDDWCVFIIDKNGYRKAPYDKEYFADLQRLASEYPEGKIYADFVKIYELTSASIDTKVAELIEQIASTYSLKDRQLAEKWFTVIYAGMVAEENKERAILKKRIKRLGMHQVLIEKKSAEYAAGFSRGKKWQELNALMKQKGF